MSLTVSNSNILSPSTVMKAENAKKTTAPTVFNHTAENTAATNKVEESGGGLALLGLLLLALVGCGEKRENKLDDYSQEIHDMNVTALSEQLESDINDIRDFYATAPSYIKYFEFCIAQSLKKDHEIIMKIDETKKQIASCKAKISKLDKRLNSNECMPPKEVLTADAQRKELESQIADLNKDIEGLENGRKYHADERDVLSKKIEKLENILSGGSVECELLSLITDRYGIDKSDVAKLVRGTSKDVYDYVDTYKYVNEKFSEFIKYSNCDYSGHQIIPRTNNYYQTIVKWYNSL